MRTTLLRRWARPLAAGSLIIVSFITSSLLGEGGVSGALMIAAAVVAGWPIAFGALRALRHRDVGIDLLVTVASVGAIAIGNYWEAAAVTFLFTVGHVLEQSTLHKTRSALAELVATAPDEAIVLVDGDQVVTPAAAVLVGQSVLVKTGAKVPVDGTVIAGAGAADESSVTGESIPAEKVAGDLVHAGTILTAGLLTVRAERVGRDTTLARIIHRVEEAQDAKAATQTFLERFSRWYTPGIILLALVSGLLTRNLELALTLLVIGCPGALVISIPVAIVAGIGRGARDGVLIKGGEFLESSARVTAVALDKTGTLTEGRPELTDVVVLGEASRADLLGLAARLEAASDHPLARPVVDGARSEGLVIADLPDGVETRHGRGVLGIVDGHQLAVGNLALAREEADGDLTAAEATVERIALAGRTPMVVVRDGEVLGVLGVADTLRDGARQMVAELHRLGVTKVVMLTGDAQAVADAVGAEVGVDDVRAHLLPEDKLEAIRELQAAGHTVAMIGDGVNDAPALATADIGVAMGAAGSATALETADIALMGDRLALLPHALGLARSTVRVMRQNIVISVAVVAVLLAGVYLGGVTMSIGMLVHEASVLLVIVNAMRLMRRRPFEGESAPHRRRGGGRSAHVVAADLDAAGAQP